MNPFLRRGHVALTRLLVASSLISISVAGAARVYAQTAAEASQSGSASLSGSVLDPRGTPLPGASVTLRDDSSGTTRKLTSDSQGTYSFSNLQIGRASCRER